MRGFRSSVCALSPARRDALDKDPSLAHELGPLVRDDLGRFDGAKRARLADCFSEMGTGYWEAVRPVLDGEVGRGMAGSARILVPRDVAVVAGALAAASPMSVARRGARRSAANTACALRELFLDAEQSQKHVLVVSMASFAPLTLVDQIPLHGMHSTW